MELRSELRSMNAINVKPIETKPKCMGDADDDKSIVEPLSPSSRLLHEPTFNLHIVAIMGFNSKINPNTFRENLGHTLLKHPRFTSLMVVDENGGSKIEWIQTEVDLDQHIIIVPEVVVEAAADAHDDDDDNTLYKNSKFVEDYVYELSKERMNMSRPLWDLHLLNVKTRDAEALAVLRMHHALGDGASIISLLLACTRQIANPHLLPTIPTKKTKYNKPKPSSNNNALKFIWNTLVDVFMFIATLLFLKDSQTPITPPPASESKPKRFAYRILSFDDFSFIKVATNTTINDVALGVTQAALSMYLNRRYGEAGKKHNGSIQEHNNLPKNVRLRSCLFFNLRPVTGIQALADMMKKEKGAKWGWGNRFGFAILPLKIAMRDDPLDYVREAKATADRKKCSYEAVFTHFLANFVIKFFGSKAAGILTNKIFSNVSTCFSNVVGPREEIEFYGHPIAFVAPTCYGQPSSLVVHFQSYANKMAVVISVDDSVIPDPNRLLDDVEKSLYLIKDAATSASN